MFEFAITVVVDASVCDFVGRQGFDQLVVSIDKTADPLIRLNLLNVVKNTSPQVLARLESLDDFRVLRWSLRLSVDQLETIK